MEGAKGRIYNDVQQIDSTLDFWQSRAAKVEALGSLNVTMLQDGDENLAAERDFEEKARLLEFIAPHSSMRLLDVGCGVGRWSDELVGQIARYIGVDFSDQLIELGRKELSRRYPHGEWQLEVLGATDLNSPLLDDVAPFECYLISGLFLYMNDDEVRECFDQMASRAADSSRIVLKDSIALSERLTLNSFESEKLGEYSAVYRTADFYEDVTQTNLAKAGFRLTASGLMYPARLANRAETAQHYWVWER